MISRYFQENDVILDGKLSFKDALGTFLNKEDLSKVDQTNKALFESIQQEYIFKGIDIIQAKIMLFVKSNNLRDLEDLMLNIKYEIGTQIIYDIED